MRAPDLTSADVIARLGAGDEVGVLHDLARLAVAEKRRLAARLGAGAGPADEPPGEDHGERLLEAALPLVAYGGAAAHNAVAKAVSHLARSLVAGGDPGAVGYRPAGQPIVGRLVWALVAQSVATRRPDFLAVLSRLSIPSPWDGRPVEVLRERGLRYPEPLGESAKSAFAHYHRWLATRSFLAEGSPYLAADIDEAVTTADLLLALALVRSERDCFSMGAARGPAFRLAYLVTTHEEAIAAFLGLDRPVAHERVLELWNRVRGMYDPFDRPDLGALLAGRPEGAWPPERPR